jgi:nitrous-oxide reductase
MTLKPNRGIATTGAVLVAFAIGAYACQPGTGGGAGAGSMVAAAEAVYVPPGEYDEFYAFMSGGFSGNLTVMGLPSGRLLKQVPVFSQYPENGWGYAEETKPMLDLHQRQQHATRRAHRPQLVRDDRDPRDPELGRKPRLALHHPEQ